MNTASESDKHILSPLACEYRRRMSFMNKAKPYYSKSVPVSDETTPLVSDTLTESTSLVVWFI